MNLETGEHFTVTAVEDSIVLQRIKPIAKKELTELLKASRKVAKDNGLKPSDITEAIKAVRARKRNNAKDQ